MLSSPPLSDSCTSPIFYVDNISSYLIDDSTNYPTSYYHSPSPLIYNNEIDNFADFVTTHDLSIIQQYMLAHNNDDNNNNSSTDIQDNASILELDNTKMDSNKSGGDHESDIINGIVEDNGEMNHIIISTSTTTTSHTNGVKIKKKRSSNKERHSKIRTAHGLRDRRMRLSLQVADPFFKLQDMLGYDKGSATIEWLLMQSKPAIDELFQSKHAGSPPSGLTTTKCTTTSSNSNDVDCEVESTAAIEEKEGDNAKEIKRASSVAKKEPKQKRKRTTKEARKVARERAKRRTLEKMQSKGQAKGGNITNSLNFASLLIPKMFQVTEFQRSRT